MDFIEYNSIKYEISYTREKDYIYASVRIEGKRITGYGISRDMAYTSIQQHVYSELQYKG